uniref:Uncharacterized protein n=1 Tax=Cyprinus carpio TaxID=7962 RepID=A0A8C1JRW4_CYPCA
MRKFPGGRTSSYFLFLCASDPWRYLKRTDLKNTNKCTDITSEMENHTR